MSTKKTWNSKYIAEKTGAITHVRDTNLILARAQRFVCAIYSGDLTGLEDNLCWLACHLLSTDCKNPALAVSGARKIKGVTVEMNPDYYTLAWHDYDGAEVENPKEICMNSIRDALWSGKDLAGAPTNAINQTDYDDSANFIEILFAESNSTAYRANMICFWAGMALRYRSKAADAWTAKKRQGAASVYAKSYCNLKEPSSQLLLVFPPFPAKAAIRLTTSLLKNPKPFVTYFGAALQTLVADSNTEPCQQALSRPFIFLTHKYARLSGMIMLSLYHEIVESTKVEPKEFLKAMVSNETANSVVNIVATLRDWGSHAPLSVNPDFPNATGWVWAKVFAPETFPKFSVKHNRILIFIFQEILNELYSHQKRKIRGLFLSSQEKLLAKQKASEFVEKCDDDFRKEVSAIIDRFRNKNLIKKKCA